PKQATDQQSGQINVTFDFTDKGRKSFQEITREIAQRGSDNADPTQLPANVSQHFAIVLDNDLISAPYIDFDENPDGIDGVNGAQISGSFTIDSAQDLAKILEIGALPIRLELVSRSQVSATLGAEALDQGLVAGAAGFIVVALFLLIFYRVLGLIALGAAWAKRSPRATRRALPRSWTRTSSRSWSRSSSSCSRPRASAALR